MKKMLKVKVIRFFHLLIFLMPVIFFAMYSYAADKIMTESNRKAIFEVVSRNINDDEENKEPVIQYFVIKKSAEDKVDKSFNEVGCNNLEHDGYIGKCNAIPLSGENFLLADCFNHNSVCYSCMLLRFNSDGTPDPTFQSPFTSSKKEILDGAAVHEIKNIRQVKIVKNGMILIEGEFISPLVGWPKEQALNEIGDSSGRAGIVTLRKDGQFDSFIPNKK